MDDEIKERVRDEGWLAERVKLLRENHFADVPQGYPIVTRFGNRARYRFGSICARKNVTHILVNRLFADPYVPVYVVDGTLAHELAHYAHGYGSGLPRLHDDPHRGGVVEKELERRGLGPLDAQSEAWRKAHWEAFYKAQCTDITARNSAKATGTAAQWETFLARPDCRTETYLLSLVKELAPRFGYTLSEVPFVFGWLHATPRQAATSYLYPKSREVRLHGLLADCRVPETLPAFEVGYWLARQKVGGSWQAVHAFLCTAGLETTARDALRWRQHAWTAFRKRNHPLC